jgi:hypothetical protein
MVKALLLAAVLGLASPVADLGFSVANEYLDLGP